MPGTRSESSVFVLVSAPPLTLSFSSIDVNSLTFDAVPPLPE